MATLILALGNPLRGDDGVGLAVLETLSEQPLPPTVELLDGGTAGMETTLLLQGYSRVIIIDAADMGLAPGTWRQFTPNEVRLQTRDMYLRGTLHYAGLAEALSLGAALNILPDEIHIFGIQPEDIGWEPGLSIPVQSVIPEVSTAIFKEITHGDCFNY